VACSIANSLRSIEHPVPLDGNARDHARVGARTAAALGTAGCAVVVGVSGELSTGALVAVLTAGGVVVALGLGRRAGEGALPIGRGGLPWAAGLVVLLALEAVALADDDLPTLSDLADPVLAHPAPRAAATLCWLAGGAWLLARPRGTVASAMRTTVGRVAVLLAWWWLGVHFLAR
jgi:hypothetical protein